MNNEIKQDYPIDFKNIPNQDRIRDVFGSRTGDKKNFSIPLSKLAQDLNLSSSGGAPIYFDGNQLPSLNDVGSPVENGDWVILQSDKYYLNINGGDPIVTLPEKISYAQFNGSHWALIDIADIPNSSAKIEEWYPNLWAKDTVKTYLGDIYRAKQDTDQVPDNNVFWEKIGGTKANLNISFGGVIDDNKDLSSPSNPIWYIANPGEYNTSPNITLTETSILTWDGLEWSYTKFSLEVRGNFLVSDNVDELRSIDDQVLSLLTNSTYKGITLLGYYDRGDTSKEINYYVSNTNEADNGGSVFDVKGVKFVHKFKGVVECEYFGVSVSLDNNDEPLDRFLKYISDNDKVGFLPQEGIYKYNTPKVVNKTIKLKGASDKTILQCNSSVNNHIAFSFDSFHSGQVVPFSNGTMVSDILFSGNERTQRVVFIQGLARSYFNNVWAKNANPINGIGIDNTAQLTKFNFCGVSTKKHQMDFIPYEGMRLRAGTRAGVSVGQASNNTFLTNYFEGLSIGVRIAEGDQNTFIGGSPEDCSVYGLLVSASSRYNTFIGTGFENKNGIDVADSGIYSKYLNCYFSNHFRAGSQSLGISIECSYGERFELQSGSKDVELKNVTYNNWNTGQGGVTGITNTTKIDNVLNKQTGVYLANNLIKTGYIKGNSISLRSKSIKNEPINLISSDGGMAASVVSDVNNGYPVLGVVLEIDRTSEFANNNSIGSFKIYSRSDNGEDVFISKKIAAFNQSTDWTPWRRLIHNNDIATDEKRGIVLQGAHVPNGSSIDTLLSVLRAAGIIKSQP